MAQRRTSISDPRLHPDGGRIAVQPIGYQLAELNFGELKHDWDDLRIKDFADGLDLVNGIAAQSPGFIWRMSDAAMEAVQRDPQGGFGGNPRIASTLSVWQDVASLEQFVWNTVHRQFYQRRHEWYEAVGNSHLVLWWVPAGHLPTVPQGMARFRHQQVHGDSDHAFGWSWLKDAQLFKS
jgi:hypothetical protein